METLAPHLPLVLSFLGGGLFGVALGYVLRGRGGSGADDSAAAASVADASVVETAPTAAHATAVRDATASTPTDSAWTTPVVAAPAALELWPEGDDADRPSILLADDRLELLAMHAAYLRKHGYRVLLAENAGSALAFARAYHPSLIVLDHSMPDRTGVEVARELKADDDTKDIPILLMTAHSFGAVGSAAMAAGCSGFLAKPVEPSRLLREIEARTTGH